jgi:hypothetical protein
VNEEKRGKERENKMKVTGTQQVSLKICAIYHSSPLSLFIGKIFFSRSFRLPLIIFKPVGNFLEMKFSAWLGENFVISGEEGLRLEVD